MILRGYKIMAFGDGTRPDDMLGIWGGGCLGPTGADDYWGDRHLHLMSEFGGDDQQPIVDGEPQKAGSVFSRLVNYLTRKGRDGETSNNNTNPEGDEIDIRYLGRLGAMIENPFGGDSVPEFVYDPQWRQMAKKYFGLSGEGCGFMDFIKRAFNGKADETGDAIDGADQGRDM